MGNLKRTLNEAHAVRVLQATVIVTAIALAGGLTVGTGSAATNGAAPLPASAQQMVPAVMQSSSLPAPTVTPLQTGKSPADTLSGLKQDEHLSSSMMNIYDLDGSPHVAQVFSTPVNYLTDDGSWAAIDPTLIQSDDGFVNKAGPFTLTFPTNWSDTSPVAFSQHGYSISMAPAGPSSAEPPKLDSTGAFLTYPDAMPGVDVKFQSTDIGYEDSIIFNDDRQNGVFAFDVTVGGGLSLSLQKDGSIGLLDAGGKLIGAMPAPTASDSATNKLTGGLDEGQVSYQLSNDGPGEYTLTLTVDPVWMASATLPVTVDPTTTLTAVTDTYVDDAFPTSSYGGSQYNYVKAVSGSNAQHTYELFPVGSLFQPNRVIIGTGSAGTRIEMYADSVANSSALVNVKKVTGGWGGGMTWNTQPSTGSTVFDSVGGAVGWHYWYVASLYQQIFDATTDDGVYFGVNSSATNNQTKYLSADYTTAADRPQLVLEYDDPPNVPSLGSPGVADTITYASPTLSLASPATDPNGDTLEIKYQIVVKSGSSCDFTSGIHWDSGWLENGDSATVPAGVLLDGQTYCWRSMVSDGFTDSSGNMVTSETSGRTLTVVLPHYGTDQRWPMWSDKIENGLSVAVNEASGNLFLNYPLDTVQTPVGPLDISLSYNSQNPDNSPGGVGRGWTLTAGSGITSSTLPSGLASIDYPNALEIRNRDGSRSAFSKAWTGNSLHVWAATGADSGQIFENTDGSTTTYTYKTTNGGRYEFSADGHLIDASPVTTDDGQPGFTYNFSGTPLRLNSITEPQAVTVNFGWDSNNWLHTITVTGLGETHVWTVTADPTSGEITQVTDPETRAVQFGYGTQSDGDSYVTSVTDGGLHTTQIGYIDPHLVAPISAPEMQVGSVNDPGTYNGSGGSTPAIPPTNFTYTGPYTGHIDTETHIEDPNGNTTAVEMDVEGFPIDVQGPPETVGTNSSYVPQTTMSWDSNGNMLCMRTPAENAIALGCVGGQSSDKLETDYTYATTTPFKLVSEVGAAPKPDGTGTRPTSTYNYDQGLTAVLQENYNSTALAGMPLARVIQTTTPLTNAWGSGQPAGITSTGGWAVRFTGRLHASQSSTATYRFRLYAQGGARLVINHKVMDDCWNNDYSSSTYNCNGAGAGSIELGGNTVTNFEVEYRHWSGDPGNIDLQWDNGTGGSFVSMPGGAFDPGLHLLTSETDPAGLTTTYSYAGAHEQREEPTTIVQSDGTSSRTETLTYDADGRVTQDTHASGTAAATTIQNTYSPTYGCLSQTVDGAGETTNYLCNAAGETTSATRVVPAIAGTQQTSQSQVRLTGYNGDGQITSTQIVGQPATATTYYPTGDIHTYTDPLGRETVYAYNQDGRTLSETDNAQDPLANQEVKTYGYDANGNQTTVTKTYGGGAGSTWSSTFDAENRVLTSAAPGVANPTSYVYDQPGALVAGDQGFLTTAVTDPAGVTKTSTLDLDGNEIDSQIGSLTPSSETRSAAGLLLSTTTPTGITRSYTYDGWRDQVTSTEPAGVGGATETTTKTYDAAGNLASRANAFGYTYTFGYDGDGHEITATQPSASNSWQFTYDGAGQLIESTDPTGRIKDTLYNSLGQPQTTYDYPSTGVTHATTYGYDADNEMIEEDPPTGPTLCYAYDDYGNRTSRFTVTASGSCQTGTKSNIDTYTYNPLSGMTSAQEGTSGPLATISYDSTNPTRVHQVTEGSTQTTYSYSPSSGQVASTAEADGTVTNTATYGYNPVSGLLSSITDPFTGAATTYLYNSAGQLTARSVPAGLTTSIGYDLDGRVSTQVTAPTGGGTTVMAFTAGYDKASRLTSLIQNFPTVGGASNPGSGTWNYGYTVRDELKTSQFNSDPVTTYTYDGANNRASVQVGSGTPVTWSYDSAGRLTSVGSTAYSWNALNELTGVGGTSYQYDPWGRQTQVSAGSTTVNDSYDALDRELTRAVVSGATTAFRYSGVSQDVVSQQIGSATPTYYAWGDGVPIAQKDSGGTKFYFQDVHTNLALITNASGSPTGTLSFDPFGTQNGGNSSSVGADATSSLFGYQSQPTDPTSGLVDMGTRLYDPSQGRFTTEDTLTGDPLNPVSMNQYAYADDSPLDFTDPDGQRPICVGCSVSKTNHLTYTWAAGYAASQGDAAAASVLRNQADYWAHHPSPPPPPAPIVVSPTLTSTHEYADMDVVLTQTLSFAEDDPNAVELKADSDGVFAAEYEEALAAGYSQGGTLSSNGDFEVNIAAELARGHINGKQVTLTVSTQLGSDRSGIPTGTVEVTAEVVTAKSDATYSIDATFEPHGPRLENSEDVDLGTTAVVTVGVAGPIAISEAGAATIPTAAPPVISYFVNRVVSVFQ